MLGVGGRPRGDALYSVALDLGTAKNESDDFYSVPQRTNEENSFFFFSSTFVLA
jgi:hypothetical protein